MNKNIKKLQIMSYILSAVWFVLFVLELVGDLSYWNHFGDSKQYATNYLIIALGIDALWLFMGVVQLMQAIKLGKLSKEKNADIRSQRYKIKQKLVVAMILLVISIPAGVFVHNAMDKAVNANTVQEANE